jgi:hypothetical protein
MKNKIPIKKRNIKREARKEIKGKSSRKISIQEKRIPHLMNMVKVIVT